MGKVVVSNFFSCNVKTLGTELMENVFEAGTVAAQLVQLYHSKSG